MLYHSLVLPLLEYCDHIYDCLSQKDSLMLECLQNATSWNILEYDRMSSATQMRTELNQDALTLCRERHTLNEMYKIVNKMLPPEICSLFTFNTYENRTLRSETRQDLAVPCCKLECGKRNFVYRGSTKWNKLPINLKRANTLKAFKKASIEDLRSLSISVHPG